MTTHPSNAAPSGRRLMLIAAGCFIANVLLIRALGGGVAEVWTITALRFAAGLALCVVFHRRELDVVALFTNPRLILRGVLGGVTTYGFYLTLIHLPTGRAIFLNNTYVVFSALLAVFMLREPFRTPLALGALIAFGGLGLLTGALLGSWQVGPYDGLALLVAAGSAWIVVAIRQLHQQGVATPTIFASQCVYGLLLCAPFLARSSTPLPPLGIGVGLVVAGVCAGAGQLAMTRAYRELTVAEGALLQTLVPLGIAIGGVLLFGEHPGWADFGGGLLIIAGSILPLILPARPAATGSRS